MVSRNLSFRRCLQQSFAPFAQTRYFPIPKESSPYAFAKIAEYVDKDLSSAERYYREAIASGERLESALKDLAGVLHQQGKTQEACQLLETHKHHISDTTKYNNLLKNLQKQICPSANSVNKLVKISGLGRNADELTVRNLFAHTRRVLHLKLDPEKAGQSATLTFSSHSAARKTLETFHGSSLLRLEWVSVTGEVTGAVNFNKEEAFSLFSSGPERKQCEVKLFYSYLPEQPCEELGNWVDSILATSILSYTVQKHYN